MSPFTRPLLVFVVMAVLVAQALTRFLDTLPGGATSNGVQGINAFLDFVLVSRIGVVPSAAVLAVLTMVFTVLAYRRQRSEQELTAKPVVGQRAAKGVVPTMHAASPERIAKAVGRTPPKAEDRPLTDGERQFLRNLLDGMTSQAVHDQKLIDAQGHEPVVVRLVPQIPLRDVEHPRSWLGGAPAMAEHIPWPQIDGRDANFLAQICCADLPDDLWDGLGPRDGWLAFFIHPTDYNMRVLHLNELGAWRQGPDTFDADGWFSASLGAKSPLKAIEAWPRWPVDLVPMRPGEPDPRLEGRSEAIHNSYKQGYDLASPEHRPFDRTSTREMLELAEARLVERLAKDWIAPLRQQLERDQTALATAERASEEPYNLAEIRDRADTYPALIEARTRGIPMFEAALAQVRLLAARIRETSDNVPLSQDEIASVMAELRKMEIINSKGQQLALTVHDGQASVWVAEFETARSDRAKHAYCASPASLPPAIRDYFEPIWRDIAAHEMAGIGHVPFGYVHEFDLDGDVTLLELPTSNLMGWMFGDVDNLVLTIKKKDLAAGRFNNLNVQVSN